MFFTIRKSFADAVASLVSRRTHYGPITCLPRNHGCTAAVKATKNVGTVHLRGAWPGCSRRGAGRLDTESAFCGTLTVEAARFSGKMAILLAASVTQSAFYGPVGHVPLSRRQWVGGRNTLQQSLDSVGSGEKNLWRIAGNSLILQVHTEIHDFYSEILLTGKLTNLENFKVSRPSSGFPMSISLGIGSLLIVKLRHSRACELKSGVLLMPFLCPVSKLAFSCRGFFIPCIGLK